MTPGELAVLLILVLVAFVPALLFLAWIRSSGRRRRESWVILLMAFLFGAIVAVFIALLLELLALTLLSSSFIREYDIFALDPSALTFLMVIVIAPIVEEAAKAIGILRTSTKIFGDLRTGLVIGAAVGLGFAATENLLYEGGALVDAGTGAFIMVAITRTFSSMLMHASATSVSGYGIARRIIKGGSWLRYFLLAVLMHASFNVFASFGELFKDQLGEGASLIGLLFAFLLAFISISWLKRKIKELS